MGWIQTGLGEGRRAVNLWQVSVNQELYFSPVRKTEEPVWQVKWYRGGPGGRETLCSEPGEQ